jgi:hypothetical protein
MMRSLVERIDQISFDPHLWQRQVIAITLNTVDGRKLDYQGEVSTSSQPSKGHMVEFDFNTSVFRPTNINIPLWMSSDTSIRLWVNGKAASDFELNASNDPTPIVYRITQDVTQFSEVNAISRIRLRIFYHGQPATTTIGDDVRFRSTAFLWRGAATKRLIRSAISFLS